MTKDRGNAAALYCLLGNNTPNVLSVPANLGRFFVPKDPKVSKRAKGRRPRARY